MMNLKTLFASLYLLITCLTSVHSFTLIKSLVTFNEFKADGACLSSIKKPAADEIGSSPTFKDCLDPVDGASTWDILQPTFVNGHLVTDGLCLSSSLVLTVCSNDAQDTTQEFSYFQSPGTISFAPPGSTQGQLKCLTVVNNSTLGSDKCDNSENQLWFMELTGTG